MRFFFGKHYRDTSVRHRDGEDIYVASNMGDLKIGNLVDIRRGIVFFSEDATMYEYDGKMCFDKIPVFEEDRFVEVEIVVEVV